MRRPFVFTLGLLTVLLIAAGVVFLVQQNTGRPVVVTQEPGEAAAVPRISVDELRGQLQTSNPPLVWDFRPAASFAEGHIPGSRVLTLDAIPDAAANVDTRQQVVTLCA